MYDVGLLFSMIDNVRNGNIFSCINKLYMKKIVIIFKVFSFFS